MKIPCNRILTSALLLVLGQAGFAGVLPDDRSDILYHLYEGGGVEIDGPSVLVRKSVAKSVSLSANYYVDMVNVRRMRGCPLPRRSAAAFPLQCHRVSA